jgi:phosphoribosylglycinamide formyltransferase-1
MRVTPSGRRLAILISGRGSNFTAIAESIASGNLDAEIGVVLSNAEAAAGLDEAKRRGFETAVVKSRGRSRDDLTADIVHVLEKYDVDLVCLAGFMRILGRRLVEAHPRAILNIHPSLLPSFPGLDVQQQALGHGVRFSGCTVHFVDQSLDGGPIILQAVVPILDGDTAQTLSARILKEEHRIYSEAIGLVLDHRCTIDGRRVLVDGADKK